jgi:hypothetical protein
MGSSGRFPDQEDVEEEEGMELDPRAAGRFLKGRNDDHLMGIPFECDLCHFCNLTLRDPIWGLTHDENELTCIRRANLDAFCSRAPSTVGANL